MLIIPLLSQPPSQDILPKNSNWCLQASREVVQNTQEIATTKPSPPRQLKSLSKEKALYDPSHAGGSPI